MFFQEDSLVNHSLSQGKEREKRITATSGQKCFEQSKSASQLGSLAKMLLESSQWYSPARRLRWRVKRISSERCIVFKNKEKSTLSPRSSMILKTEDILSKHLLYQLSPLARHIEETECGLLPTPMTQGLKTMDENGRMTPLPPTLLPTPTACEGDRGGQKVTGLTKTRPSGQKYSCTLSDLAASRLLPTPTAMAAKGNVTKDRGRGNLTDEIARIYQPEESEEVGNTSLLNPLYVEEMMGFPENWMLSPFLVGEQKP